MKRNASNNIPKILGEATQSHQMQRNVDPMVRRHLFTRFSVQWPIMASKESIMTSQIVKQKKKKKPKGILNYFVKQSLNCDQNSSKSRDIEFVEEKNINKTVIQSERVSIPQTSDKSSDCSLFTPKALSIATNSLILFDDIDVID